MRLSKLTAALVAAGLALPACAASDAATLQKLMERMEKLEARNAELEKEVKALKNESAEIAKGLDSPRLSENEPELTVRLKATEKDVLEMKKSSKVVESLEGIKATAALATVVQGASGLPSGTPDSGTQLNYRADVEVEIPLAKVADVGESKLFFHIRAGQGEAGALIPPFEHHILTNAGDTPAVTLHVYSHELTSCHVFEPVDGGWRRKYVELAYTA